MNQYYIVSIIIHVLAFPSMVILSTGGHDVPFNPGIIIGPCVYLAMIATSMVLRSRYSKSYGYTDFKVSIGLILLWILFLVCEDSLVPYYLDSSFIGFFGYIFVLLISFGPLYISFGRKVRISLLGILTIFVMYSTMDLFFTLSHISYEKELHSGWVGVNRYDLIEYQNQKCDFYYVLHYSECRGIINMSGEKCFGPYNGICIPVDFKQK